MSQAHLLLWTEEERDCGCVGAVREAEGGKRESGLGGGGRRGEKTLSKQSELTNGVKEEVDVLGPLSLIVFTISVDVKQH